MALREQDVPVSEILIFWQDNALEKIQHWDSWLELFEATLIVSSSISEDEQPWDAS